MASSNKSSIQITEQPRHESFNLGSVRENHGVSTGEIGHESFMKILKYEEIYLSEYETYEDAVNRLPHFIETIYNRKRIHSSIGYLTPEEFEVTITKQKQEPKPLHII